ncbi:MAG: aldehyde dehydrogenase family protein, partial [Acidobacteria bacterium]|nr:aldehyde dehydrogenase family protein [Acidobacteriota bacterium]
MTRLSDQDIEAIARTIAADLSGKPRAADARQVSASPVQAPAAGVGIFATVDDAARAAKAAQPVFAALPIRTRAAILASIRATMRENAEALAKSAHEETGLGRYEDKIVKNR